MALFAPTLLIASPQSVVSPRASINWTETSVQDFRDGELDPMIYVSPRAQLDPDSGCIEFFARFDVDNNGYYDLVCADDSGPWLHLYFGSAAGYSPSDCRRYPVPGGGNIDLADLNLDGYAELIHSGWRSGHVTIYWGTNSGPLPTDTSRLPISGQSEAVAVYDLDRDSYLDILAGSDNGNLYIFWGSGRGYSGTNRSSVYLGGKVGHNLEVADFDRDGHADIAASLWSRNRAPIVYWGAGRTPREIVWLPVSPNNPHGITVADLNDDDWLDIVLTGYDTVTTAFVYYGSESGFSVTRRELIRPGQCYGGSAAVAWNSDKTLDLVFFRGDWGRTSTFRPRVYLNRLDTTPHFSDARTAEIGDLAFNASGGFAADLNFDGHLDLFVNNMLPDSSSFVLWGPDFLSATALPVDRDHHGVWREPGNIYTRGFYASYLSSVFDIGPDSIVASGACSWIAREPTGTAVGIEVRAGRTAEPDSTWTDFYPIAFNGGAVPATVTGYRFLQYRSRFSYTRPCFLPHLERISFELNRTTSIDVGVSAIIAPLGTVDSGTVVTPAAAIRNYQDGTPEVRVRLTIGTTYAATVIDTLMPGATDTVVFPAWTATIPGPHTVRCSAYARLDGNPANDTLSTMVRVRAESDIGPIAILSPPVVIESGSVHVPSVAVRNFGTRPATFPIHLWIGSSYYQVVADTLVPGASDTVFFPAWTASPPGPQLVRCSTALTRDTNPANDTISRLTTVLARIDASAIAVLAPADTVDSGAVIMPQARIANLGTSPALIPVRMKVGPTYSRDTSVLVSPAETVLVSFPAWTASPLGTHPVRCSTMLAGDTAHTNDFITDSVFVIARRDAYSIAILAPFGALDSGTAVTPVCRIGNGGTSPSLIPVRLRIGSAYDETVSKLLVPGMTDTVRFPEWTASTVGLIPVRCSTALSGDEDPADDTISTLVTVRPLIDAAPVTVLAPTGVVDSGTVVTPRVAVANLGSRPENIPLRLTIGSVYADTVTALVLPGDTDTFAFAVWAARPIGLITIRCSTGLALDRHPENDTLSAEVSVIRMVDAAAVAVVAPTGRLDSGTVVTPRARIANLGTRTTFIPTILQIGNFYADTVLVNVHPAETLTVRFAAWTARPVGLHAVRCSTALAGDANSANNLVLDSVLVATHVDAAALRVLAPVGRIDSGMVVAPACVMANYSTGPKLIPVRLTIGTTYSDSTSRYLAPGESANVSFTDWHATPPGTHGVQVVVALPDDEVPANDTIADSVTVSARTDAGIAAILAPLGTIDSGTTAIPVCRVVNNSVSPKLVPVSLAIGSFYRDERNKYLLPGEEDTVTFAEWSASELGALAVRCSTALAGDENPANDTLSTEVLVRLRVDATAVAVIAPVGVVDSGMTVTPLAVVANRGARAESIPVHLSIGLGYRESTSVALLPDSSTAVLFPSWLADEVGTFRVCCSTALTGDLKPANDTAVTLVTVATRHDASCCLILSPTGVLDSGRMAIPAARVTNVGTSPELVPIVMRIDGGYCDTTLVRIAPGESVTVNFDAWEASPAGLLSVRCSTALPGDTTTTNDQAIDSVFVATRPDAAVTDIYAPLGVVDSGMAIAPLARICNYGTSPANISVRMRIGNSYDETRSKSVAIGDKDTVQFPVWVATPPGVHVVLCSTALSGDVRPENDRRLDSVRVTTTVDAGVVGIVAPAGRVDSGATVVPLAVVANYGTSPAFVPVRMRIGSDFDSMVFKYVSPGTEDTVAFPAWLASLVGASPVRCSTALPGDLFVGNDNLVSSVLVGVSVDAACLGIEAPAGTVDSGAAVIPLARIANYSTGPKEVPVLLRIGDDYVRGRRKRLAPGAADTVTFPPWTAHQRGLVALTCSTALSGDERTKNDAVRGTVFVHDHLDAAVLDILVPIGLVDSGHLVTPKARIVNYGATVSVIPVEFRVGDFYRSRRTKTFAPGTADTVHFDVWTATELGRHTVRCTTVFAGDQDPANDFLDAEVHVQWRDAGCVAILAPPGVVRAGDTITPRARVRNFGTRSECVPVVFRYGPLYASLQFSDTLPPGDSAEVTFPTLVAAQGSIAASCSTALHCDMNPPNDKLALTVYGAIRRVVVENDTAALVPPASIVSYFLRCRNEGNAADTIDIKSLRTRTGWRVELLDSATLEPLFDLNHNGLPDVGHLPVGGSSPFVCRLTLPANELGLITDSTEIQASSGADPQVKHRCRTYTTVQALTGLTIEPDHFCRIPPGRPYECSFTITNLGNIEDYADIAFYCTKARWRHELLDAAGRSLDDRNANGRRDVGPIRPHSGTAELILRLTPDSRAQVGERDTTTVLAQSFADLMVTDTAVAVSEISGAVWGIVVDPDQTASVNLGKSICLPFWVETAGELRAVVNVAAICSRPDWQLRLLNETGQQELRDADFDSVPDLGFVTPAVRTSFALQVTAPGSERVLEYADSLTAVVTVCASLSGSPAVCDTARVRITAVPNFEVHNFANPFSDRTRFVYSTPYRGCISLLVYNRLGELVRTIIDREDRKPGVFSVEWDGTNDLGRRLAPGVYVYVYEAASAGGGTQRLVRKAVLKR